MFAALGPIMPHARSGKVRALAVTTPRRSPLAPELPAVGEALPGYASEAAIGFFAPKKTSSSIVKLLNHEIVQALKATDPQMVFNSGVEIVGNSPDDFARFIKADMTRMNEVIKSGSFSN